MLKRIKLRTLAIGGLFTLFFVVIVGRLFWYQVWNQQFWVDGAKAFWSREQKLTPIRGTIYDRNGEVLAMDAPAYTVTVGPKKIQELRTSKELIKKNIDVERLIVDELYKVLNKPEHELYTLLRSQRATGDYYDNREFREGWKVEEEKAAPLRQFIKKLQKENLCGQDCLSLVPQMKRFYVKDQLASHVLGYIDREDKPISGIEKRFDEQLKGKPGSAQYERDRRGYKLPNAPEIYKPKQDGQSAYLTIDYTIQQYIEEEMRKIYDKYLPHTITVIAVDPKTGDILGLANLPNFNPNKYWTEDMRNFNNPAIHARYEPGSTFKMVTLAAAVQEGIFDPNAYFQSGSIRAGGRTIRDWETHWGTITYLEGLKRSSNVAFVKLGFERLKEEKLKEYIDKFGFGSPTGIELPWEKGGQIEFQYPADVAAASYGHGKVWVTPMQQIMAVAALANGGKLMKPHLVRKIEDRVTGQATERTPEVMRQVIRPDVAKQVSEYLEQVVADQQIGTGRAAYIAGYRVAGKTGTALKVIDGKYDERREIVSFSGYAPVEDPRIAVLVVVDDPQNYPEGGGFITASMFKKIVSQSLRHLGVPPANRQKGKSDIKSTVGHIQAPQLEGMKLFDAKQKLEDSGIIFETLGVGNVVKRQYPAPIEPLAAGQRVYLLTDEAEKLTLPNLKGKSLRDAMEIASLLQWKVRVEGEGYVIEQKTDTEQGQRVVEMKLAPQKT